MARSRTRSSVYVVCRVALSVSRYGEAPIVWANDEKHPVKGIPLEGFATKQAATALQKKLERQARESTPVGPYLDNLLPNRQLLIVKAATTVGLPPPDPSAAGPPVEPERSPYGGLAYGQAYYDYTHRLEKVIGDWWAAQAVDVTPEQNAQLWAFLFPEHRFYDVVRVPLGE
ncbi:MAG TPA: hypothetical protein VEL76_01800 [Gemmataceae bacterium]|nr:hypothetical protein [Gemmataceae bacterium]